MDIYIEPHIGYVKENEKKGSEKVSGNYVISVDANTFTVWAKGTFESPACT